MKNYYTTEYSVRNYPSPAKLQRFITGYSGLFLGLLELAKGTVEMFPSYILENHPELYPRLAVIGLVAENTELARVFDNIGKIDISAGFTLLILSTFYILNQGRKNYSE